MMLPTWSDLSALVALGDPGKAVDLLLNTASNPAPPTCADHATESLDSLDTISRGMVMGEWDADGATLRNWWTAIQQKASLSIVEKMTFFWSGHFTSKFVDEQNYVIAPLLYRQNKFLREHALGNFKDLVNGITLDGAMLVFLGGNTNSVGAPNENYARELMELFTTGLGQYTEGDVQSAARILTGWRIAQYNDHPAPNGIFATYFDPSAHDIGAKQFMSTAFPARDSTTNTEYLVRQQEIAKLVDTLFTQRTTAIANFICAKFYRYFVYSNPAGTDTSVVSAMADLFIQNNFDIKPVMSALLKSAHFFDNLNIGAQIKTPAEYTIGLARQLTLGNSIDASMTAMGQQFFEPPNVSGWPGYHDWITTSTYPVRGRLAENTVTAMSDSDVLAFINQFSNNTNASALATQIGELMLPRPLSANRLALFMQKLTAGAPDYEWASILSNSPATAARTLRDLLTLIVALPDYELC